MSKLAIQYTDDNGRVFSIEAEGALFLAGRSDLNEGVLVNIPEMTDQQAWDLSPEEGVVIQYGISLGNEVGAFDPCDSIETFPIESH